MSQRHAAVLLLAVAACGGGGGGPKVALRYHPPAGAVYHYGLEQRTRISMQTGPLAAMGNQQLFMRVRFTQTVKGPTDGGTEVDVVFESMEMEIPGVSPDVIARELAKMNGLRSTIVYDATGKIVRSSFAAAPGVDSNLTREMASGVQAMTFGFPDHPVGKGDSWTIATDLPLPALPGGGANTTKPSPAKTTLTVREVRITGADTSVVLDIKTAFPSEPIPVRTAGQTATLKLDGDLAGHQQFSISRGAILDGTIKGSTKMHIATAMFGAKGLDMLTDTESSISLLP
jgi:hypothetical protein